jgi:sensor c-di-GMP phosphodiesterase-like protein
MDVIAEGVETEKHLGHLKEMKCRFGQGYFFSKPVNNQAAGALLHAEQQQAGLPLCAPLKPQEEAELLESSLVM